MQHAYCSKALKSSHSQWCIDEHLHSWCTLCSAVLISQAVLLMRMLIAQGAAPPLARYAAMAVDSQVRASCCIGSTPWSLLQSPVLDNTSISSAGGSYRFSNKHAATLPRSFGTKALPTQCRCPTLPAGLSQKHRWCRTNVQHHDPVP